jgi:hypothetical protein
MIDLNIANFLTIGLIAVLFTAALMWGSRAVGVDLTWLTA